MEADNPRELPPLDPTVNTVGARIRVLRKYKKMTLEQVATLIGTDTGNLSRVETGKQGASEELIKRIAKALETHPAIFWGNAQIGDRHFDALPNPFKPQPVDFETNMDYAPIRRVNFKLSAGASGFAVDYLGEDASPIFFLRSWFEKHGYTPGKLFAIKVANGSMEPGMYDGDTLVVNTESTAARDGVAFAINYEGESVVKRLVRDEGQWWLSSDNPDQRRYPRKRMTEDCFIIGEIVLRQSERV